MAEGYLKGRIRREDILAAASAAYGQSGYHAASLRDIAKRVGISHAGLLYHFPTKEALLAAVLQRRDAQDAQREQLMGSPGVGVLRSFLALAAHNTRHRAIVDVYGRLAAEAVAGEHPAHEYFVKHYRDARALITEAFQVMAAKEQLRAGVDPRQAAVGFIALMDGLQVQWLTSPADIDMAETLRFYLKSLVTVSLE